MSWNEKLRRAAEEQVAKLKYDQEQARSYAEWKINQAEQKRQESVREQALYQQLPQILEKFNSKQLLEDIRNRVWKTPNAKIALYDPDPTKKNHVFCGSWGYKLAYRYPSWSKEWKNYGSGPESSGGYTGKINRSDAETVLAIGVGVERPGTFLEPSTYKGLKEEVTYLRVWDSAVQLYPTKDADHFLRLYASEYNYSIHGPSDYIDIKDPQAAEMLEELLMRSCLRRINSNRLPLQLEINASQEIEQLKRARWRGNYWED